MKPRPAHLRLGRLLRPLRFLVFWAALAPSTLAPALASAQTSPAPNAPAPGVPAPGLPAPAPGWAQAPTAPNAPASSFPAPSFPAPSFPAPSFPSPSFPAPGVPAPGVPAPGAPAPAPGWAQVPPAPDSAATAPASVRAISAPDSAATTPAELAPLTLTEVVRSTEAAYPLLRAAELERDIARADLLSAEGGFDISWRTRAAVAPLGYYQYQRIDTVVEVPTQLWGSTFFAGYRLGRGDIPSYYGELATLSAGEVRGGVNVPLWRNGPTDRRRANLWRAEAGRQVADLGVAQQRLETVRAASYRYWDWVAAGRRLAIARDLLALAEARDAGLTARVARGDVPAFERDDNARAILQRQAQVVAAERALAGAALELSLFLRGPDGRPLLADPGRLPRGLPEPDAAPAGAADKVDVALQRRPELGRLEAMRTQTEVELRWAKNQRAPGLDAQFVVSRDIGEGSPTLRPTAVEAAVLLDVPLQTRVAEGRVDAARAQLARLEAQRAFARERIAVEVRDSLVTIDAARRRAEVARSELDLARRLERGERARFELGDGTLLVVNLREQATADAAWREVDALADYHRAVAAYRAATGEGAERAGR
ncbi:MAG TPA: TolC family protein [Polyangiaceae bacterium]|nr:TolC family protein [Polyangiaceae bacterium]